MDRFEGGSCKVGEPELWNRRSRGSDGTAGRKKAWIYGISSQFPAFWQKLLRSVRMLSPTFGPSGPIPMHTEAMPGYRCSRLVRRHPKGIFGDCPFQFLGSVAKAKDQSTVFEPRLCKGNLRDSRVRLLYFLRSGWRPKSWRTEGDRNVFTASPGSKPLLERPRVLCLEGNL